MSSQNRNSLFSILATAAILLTLVLPFHAFAFTDPDDFWLESKAPSKNEQAAPLLLDHSKDAFAEYAVQPGDVLSISVWKESDLQGDVVVRPDGKFSFPLIGEVVASEKTVEQLRKEIEASIGRYVPDAMVTIIIKQVLGNKIYVVGKVNRPGEFVVNRAIDVMQALGLAGGATSYADVDEIIILRRQGNEQLVLPFSYEAVEKGIHLEQNIILRTGDTVVVP